MLTWLADNSKYFFVLLGLLIGLPGLWERGEKLGLRRFWQAPLTALGFSAASVLSAMLFAALEQVIGGETPHFGAVSLFGVFLICPLFLLAAGALLRADLGRLFDAYAVYALPSLFLMRCNCLISGCCGGTALFGTRLTWPVRQAEMVFYVVMALALFHRERKGARPGTAFPLLMCCYGALRFLLEWARVSDGPGPFHLSHVWAAISFLIGMWIYQRQVHQFGRERSRSKCSKK